MAVSTVEKPVTPSGSPPPRATPRWRRKLRPYLLTIPAVAIIIGILYPFFLGVFYTFFDFSATNPNPPFVGLQNFFTVFTSGGFWYSVYITLLYAVLTTGVETVLGVGVALLLNRSTLVGKVLEKLLIMPLMIAPVVATVIWKLMLQPSVGIVNYLTRTLFGANPQWTDTPTGALLTSVTIDVWIYTPFVAILVLAGLRSLPREPYEAASVDGASFWYTFRRLQLPMLWPYILLAVIFRFMDSVKIFDIIYALTQGGPGDSMVVLQIRAYLDSIQFFKYSTGLTYMFVLWVTVFVVARVLVGVLGKAQRRAAGEEVG